LNWWQQMPAGHLLFLIYPEADTTLIHDSLFLITFQKSAYDFSEA